MRALTTALMAAGVVALGLAVAVVGRNVAPGGGRQDAAVEREMFGPPVPADHGQGEAGLLDSGDPARPVAPGTVPPPQVDTSALQRAAPRDPLSPLGQALPPPPPKPDDWGGTILYRPVATASARFEAKGYKVAIAGTESIDPAQTCTSGGVEWQCGIHARTAVRLWLRGRALSCQLPPEADREFIVANCRLGKQDVGAWLVSNGWARAVAGGPYAAAEQKARKAKAGIFGTDPSLLPVLSSSKKRGGTPGPADEAIE
jgi:endonuclease YncB( thermonuclease family)